ncbi:hypothetical protein HPY1846_01385 [Helicobacter pylori]|nr:hypothetical protein HPY1846_01385 [Helicobacter pylori]
MAIYLGNILQYSSSEACINLDLPCASCYKLGLPKQAKLLQLWWALTPPFHPYLKKAVCFLWHFPLACASHPLDGILSNVARTFLYSKIATIF